MFLKKHSILLYYLLVILFPFNSTYGEKKPRFAANESVRIHFENSEWNQNPTLLDEGFIMVFDRSSGKSVIVPLKETSENSGFFSGVFQITWDNAKDTHPIIYVPTVDFSLTSNQKININAAIKNGQIKRASFILSLNEYNQRQIEIFTSRKNLQAAIQRQKIEQSILRLNAPMQPTQLETDSLKSLQDLESQEIVNQGIQTRLRLEAKFRQNIRERIQAFKELSSEEQKKQVRLSQERVDEAMALYNEGMYADAAEEFDAAFSKNPSNFSSLYKYGVSLYRTEDFHRSIVALRLSQGDDIDTTEKHFFLGLNSMALREYAPAQKYFEYVVENDDTDFAVNAQFYIGISMTQQKLFSEARDAFQNVLDTSQNPELDRRAEASILRIIRLEQFEAERRQKWFIHGNLGAIYDTNILLTSDSLRDQGVATEEDGIRWLTQTGISYRPIYEAEKEWRIHAQLLNLFTVDTDFDTKQSIRNTDPLVITFTAPYTHRGILFDRGYNFTLRPGYEKTFMSIENNEFKEILSSAYFDIQYTALMSENWHQTFLTGARFDNSKLASSTGNTDSTAVKTTFSYGHLFILGEDKNKFLQFNLSYIINQAKGDTSTFNRLDSQVAYIHPLFWNLRGNFTLNYYQNSYFLREPNQTDKNLTVGLGINRKINNWAEISAGLRNTQQNSNNPSSEYDKWSSYLILTMGHRF